MSRLYAIPDIHGRFDLLLSLWQTLETKEGLDLTKDKVVFLGDMIDRGPESRQVVEFIHDLWTEHPEQIVVLAGNHEWLMIDAIRNPYDKDAEYLWDVNGGWSTLESYPIGRRYQIEEDVKWMAKLPLSHEEPGFFFSHAPVPREEDRRMPWKGGQFSRDELIWTYESPEWKYARNFQEDDGKDLIGVCGHVHQLQNKIREPRFYDHYIFADAGCGCSRKAPLVAIEVRTRQVIYSWPIEAQETQS